MRQFSYSYSLLYSSALSLSTFRFVQLISKNNQSKPVPKMLTSAEIPKSVLSVNSGDSSHRSNIPTKSQQQGMSSTEANELVASSASQKKIWISWKDKIQGTDRRKEERKSVQTKLRKYMISFFPILVGLQIKPLTGTDTVGSLPKLNLKLKVHNYKHNWWLQTMVV